LSFAVYPVRERRGACSFPLGPFSFGKSAPEMSDLDPIAAAQRAALNDISNKSAMSSGYEKVPPDRLPPECCASLA
jgi:hypothetical protein